MHVGCRQGMLNRAQLQVACHFHVGQLQVLRSLSASEKTTEVCQAYTLGVSGSIVKITLRRTGLQAVNVAFGTQESDKATPHSARIRT